MGIARESFGITSKGKTPVERYVLTNERGTTATVLTYGATLQSLVFDGIDVVLGFDTLTGYERQTSYIGGTVGRVANRIAKGKFTLGEKSYTLAQNNGENHLHGGNYGFDKQVWQAEIQGDALYLRYISADGEEGYPGRLQVEVMYRLGADDTLTIHYYAIADADTLVNLTNHSYFNLNGHEGGTLEGTTLQIFADSFMENDENCLPTGRVKSVTHTPMDFRTPQGILDRIENEDEQLKNGGGYDHNWVVQGEGLRPCAYAWGLKSGIRMDVKTDQPGVQLYTANFLDVNGQKGKGGVEYPLRSGFCLETQGYPDAITHSSFPSPILKAGEPYERTTMLHLKREGYQ